MLSGAIDTQLIRPLIIYFLIYRKRQKNIILFCCAEDKLKDKRKAKLKERNEYAITSDMLVEIIEESIRIFWKFVRADKDCMVVIAKVRNETTELQDPADFELLSDVLKNLQQVSS